MDDEHIITFTEKPCTKCKQIKPWNTEYFGMKSGLPRQPCRECWNGARRAKYLAEIDKEREYGRRRTERKRAYRGEHPLLPRFYQSSLLKQCSKCGELKPRTTEYFGKRQRRGWSACCNKCKYLYQKQWAATHPEEAKARRRRSYETRGGSIREYQITNKDKINEQRRRSRLNPNVKERQRKQAAKHRQSDKYHQRRIANVDKEKEYRRRYWNLNPDKKRQYNHARRAKLNELPSTLTEQHWDRALKYFHGCCAYCGKPPSLFDYSTVLHQEHFVAVVNGGGYTPDNILPACQSCNISKRDRNAHEWLRSRFNSTKTKRIEANIESYFKWIKD